MARGKGPVVFFTRVRMGAAKAKPFLRPGLKVGRRALLAAIQSSVATLKTTNPRVIRSGLSTAVRTGAFATSAAAKLHAPKGETGLLRNSIHPRQRGEFSYTVGTNVIYARPVEEGRKGGTIIEPVRAKALRFHWRNAPPGVRKRFRRKRSRR